MPADALEARRSERRVIHSLVARRFMDLGLKRDLVGDGLMPFKSFSDTS